MVSPRRTDGGPGTSSGFGASSSANVSPLAKRYSEGIGNDESPPNKRQRLRHDDGTWAPPSFGDFGHYMEQRKAKMKEQDAVRHQVSDQAPEVPQLFFGMTLHINGYTAEVSQQELKELILCHGGDYDHYLSKTTTTHIVASNLTEAKKKEFKNYRVASPQWILESISQGKLLPWHDFSVLGALRARDATDPRFLDQFYHNSRLHFLSKWKAELQELVRPMQQELQSRKRQADIVFKVIMHIDMDSFFVAVSMLDRPDLSDKPVGVSHASSGHDGGWSDIASCNYVARKAGVKNGMLSGKAKQICPDLVLLPYRFDLYRETTEKLYKALCEYADDIQAISCDEAYIDVSSRIESLDDVLPLAERIRADIFAATRCTASVGAGENMLLARIATRRAKPNGSFHYASSDEFLNDLDTIAVRDMPGIGSSTAEKLKAQGMETALDVFRASKEKLQTELGKKLVFKSLYQACRGIDDKTFGYKPRQSVGAEVNYGIRFNTHEEAYAFLHNLCSEVCQRLFKADVHAGHVTLKIMKAATTADPRKHNGHGICDNFSKSISIQVPTREAKVLAPIVCRLLDAMQIEPSQMRGVGVSCSKLSGREQEAPQGPTILNFIKRSPTKEPANRASSSTDDDDSIIYVSEESPSKRRALKISERQGSPTRTSSRRHERQSSPSRNSAKRYQQHEIDWEVFKSLPEEIQREIRQGWAQAGNSSSSASARLGSPSNRAPARPHLRDRQQLSLHDLHRPAGHKPQVPTDSVSPKEIDELVWKELDPTVLEELPEYIREEVIREKKREITARLSAERSALVSAKQPKAVPPPERSRHYNNITSVADGPMRRSMPALLDQTEMPEVRKLLREWVEHTVDHIWTTDVDTDIAFVHSYIKELIREGFLDEATRVLQYLQYLMAQLDASGDARPIVQAVEGVVAGTQAIVLDIYGCILKL